MCTILTVNSAFYSRGLERRILADAAGNNHGFSLLLTDENGALLALRSMDIDPIIALIRATKWERLFLHSRWATQGEVSLANTHGWQSDAVFYFHNGSLMSDDAYVYPVDSQAIGQWIVEGGIGGALEKLRDEPFANVFMVDTEAGYYTVSRGTAGSLYTDGNGNYSTNAFDAIKVKVIDNSNESYIFSECLYEEHESPSAVKDTWDEPDPTISEEELEGFRDSWSLREREERAILSGHHWRGLVDDYDIDAEGVSDWLPRNKRKA